MGVMTCNRQNCGNIMCDIYINDIGYICYECKNEFKDYLNSENKTNLSEGEMTIELKKFMNNTTKGKYIKGKIFDIDEFFDKYKQ